MKKIKILFLFLSILLISGCSNSNLEKISYKEFNKMVENKETFILELMNKDCSACDSLKPDLEKVSKKYDLDIKYIDTSDLSEKEYLELQNKLNFTGTPTIVFFEKGEEESIATRINGAVPKEKLIDKLKDMGYIK